MLVAEGGVKDDEWGHYGIGAWEYSARRDDQLTPSEKARSKGFYLLADRSFYSDENRDMSAFARLGFAAGDVEQFKNSWSLGVVLSGYVPTRPDGQLGLAVAQANNASKYKDANAPVESRETQFELTYADKLMPWLSVQPDLQYTINPGTDPALDNAWTAGLRSSIDF